MSFFVLILINHLDENFAETPYIYLSQCICLFKTIFILFLIEFERLKGLVKILISSFISKANQVKQLSGKKENLLN